MPEPSKDERHVLTEEERVKLPNYRAQHNYRIYDPFIKEMVYFSLFDLFTGFYEAGIHMIHYGIHRQLFAMLHYHALADLLVMEGTGYADKFGQEIFDGDILKMDDEDELLTVKWETFSDCCVKGETWMLHASDGEYGYEPTVYYHIEELEVVGNIHQDSSLLVAKKAE